MSRRSRDPADEVFPYTGGTDGLARITVRGGTATAAAQVIKFALALTSNIILARLLSPRDFGLAAMATAATALASLVRDLGLSLSTVQRPRITHRQVSTLFWLNIGVSLLLALLMAAISPLIARFYEEPAVAYIVMALSVQFVLAGLAAQHTALLRRQLRFGWLSAIEAISQGIGVATAILLAVLGAGYWAIVSLPIANAIALTTLTWSRSGWWPGRPGRLRDVGEMIAFGANFTGSNVLTALSRQLDNILIGWRWGAAPLGLYSRAYALLLLPLKQINTPMTGLALPVLSRLQDDPTQYRRYYSFALNLINHLTMPLIVLLAVLAPEAIVFAIGEEWADAAPIFTILAVAAIGQPTLFTLSWVTTSLGRTDKHLRYSLVTAPVVIASFLVGLPWGPIGVAAAYAVAVNAIVLPSMNYAFRDSPLRLADLGRAVARPLASSTLLGGAAFATRHLLGEGASEFEVLASAATACLAVYAVQLVAWPDFRREIFSIAGMLRKLRD